MADKHNLLLLFDRPTEPVFVSKGNKATVFDVPSNFLTDHYKPMGVSLQSRFGEESSSKVSVSDVSAPDLGDITSLGRRENFSLFIPKHSRIAGKLITLFVQAKDVNELQSLAAYCRDRVNPYLFNYALHVALLHRPDTKDLDVPSFVHYFPSKFVDSRAFNKAREELTTLPENARVRLICIC